MPYKILLFAAPYAANALLGVLTGKTHNLINVKVGSRTLSLLLTFVLGGLSFLASQELTKAFLVEQQREASAS